MTAKTYPTPVPEELIYREHNAGSGMRLACGHRADGIIRGSGGLYHCPTCRTAEESIYSVQAEARYQASGWGGVFRRVRRRVKQSPDAELAALVRIILPFVEDIEGRGWSHGHRDDEGYCSCSGDDCDYCDRLEKVRKWADRSAA